MKEWLISFALSRSGLVVRWAVGYVVGHIAMSHIVPDDALPTIQRGLESGGSALAALLYAYGQYWLLQERNKQAAGHIATALMTPPGDMIGDETVGEFTKRTGIPVVKAIPCDGQ